MTREDRKELNAENYPASVLSWLHKITDEIYDDFESRTCESCKHHFSQTINYGNCERNGTPTPTEYSWFCAGWESKDDK